MVYIEECGKPLSKKTKGELIEDIKRLTTSNTELRSDVEEYRAEYMKVCQENGALHKEIENLWNVINRAVDLKEMLDDVEDATEELKDACKLLRKDFDKED